MTIKIKDLFNYEKGSLQSTKCIPGEYDFITASKDWKTHNEYTHKGEALIFAAAASGSLGRTHYVNGKFISSDLCFILTPKDKKKYPIDMEFYHILFETLKDNIVSNTKSGTSKEAIGLRSFGKFDMPYIGIEKQKQISKRFLSATKISDSFSSELNHQTTILLKLRQAFLREAMQGKLVSNQTKTNQTGTELLEEIKTEKQRLYKAKKIRKPKQLDPIAVSLPPSTSCLIKNEGLGLFQKFNR